MRELSDPSGPNGDPRDLTARSGVTRRDFLRICSILTATLALPARFTEQVAHALTRPGRPPVLWLEFQDCAGDTESLLRSSHPSPAQLVLDLISLNYHETIMAPSGDAAEKSLRDTMASSKGAYLVIVEGSIPTADGGVHCTIGGKTAVQILREVADGAAAIIAVGTCASFGGLPAAAPNPTKAVGVRDLVKGKPVLNLPGCSVNAITLAATVTHFLTFGALPAADDLGRPLFAYGDLVHDNCPRRGHFDSGEYVREWGDEGHRQGWCVYRMGCKGPRAHANCPQVGWNDNTSWPIAAGHPCLACTEPKFWDTSAPFYEWMGESHLPASARAPRRAAGAGVALGVGGLVAAGAAGTVVMAKQRARAAEPEKPGDDAAGEGM